MIDQENDEYGRESSYLGNYQIKRHGVIEKWTPEKLREYVLCSQDPIYFIENHPNVDIAIVGIFPKPIVIVV
jgi:hypothetical protein